MCCEYERGLQVLKECHRQRPKLVIPVLQAAKLCYEHLHKEVNDQIPPKFSNFSKYIYLIELY
ncbi:Tetratricopeptide repeat protein 7B [Mactra antiquata]